MEGQEQSDAAPSICIFQSKEDASAGALAPRPKRQKLASPSVVVLSRDDKRDQVHNDIRLPRPGAGNLVYSVAEAVSVVKNLVKSNSIHPPRLFLAMVKEKLINEKRIPVQRCQFNCILKAADDGAPTPICWNTRGRPDIISLEDLKSQFDDHAKRDGKGWDVSNTREAIFDAMKKKRESDGLDASTMEPPSNKTVSAYHAALTSTSGLTTRLCKPKTAAREASETSIRSMLTFVCILLNAMSYVCPDASSIPPEFRFDETTASPGLLQSRHIVAQSHGVPDSHIQFMSPHLFFNGDDSDRTVASVARQRHAQRRLQSK